ncbi:MAG: hypothetical protein H7A45_20515 [Verrucomicrobiales bacterium]|nr:hypothetical protein [Verrucomicrobiales bacterium]
MQQIKIFKSTELDLELVERSVNEWLAQNQVRVVNIFGNIAPQGPKQGQSSVLTKSGHSPSDLLLVVVYEKE